jgi:hypothetical protein
MRIKTLFFFSISLLSLCTRAQQSDETYGKPLVVLTETNPWLMVAGSDTPSFVLYEKGRVIYKAFKKKHLKIYEATLTGQELRELIKSLSVTDEFYKLNDNITASDWTDQPTTILTINLDRSKKIEVYGNISSNESRQKTPAAFLSVYDKIKKFKGSNAKEWVPKKIEVLFWDYNYAPKKRPWIKGFPDLNSPTTTKFGNDSYSVFIEGDKLGQLKKYISSMAEKEAVEINGQKMAVSYRLRFPNVD